MSTNLVTTNSPNEQQASLYEYLNNLTLDGNTITQITFSSGGCYITMNSLKYRLYDDGRIEREGGYGGQ